jgi:hypothetical protein
MNLVHTVLYHLFKINFDLIFSSISRSSKRSDFFKIRIKIILLSTLRSFKWYSFYFTKTLYACLFSVCMWHITLPYSFFLIASHEALHEVIFFSSVLPFSSYVQISSSAPYSRTLSSVFFTQCDNQVPHPYKITIKIIKTEKQIGQCP